MGNTEGSSATVVVLDPDPAVSADLEAALDASIREFQVIAASGPRELPEWWVERADCVVSEFDLSSEAGTVSDGGTPHQPADGLAVLSEVRAVSADLPVIIYTDAGDERVASEAIAAGVTEYVTKADVSPEDLANRIDRALTTYRERVQAERTRQVNEVFRRVDMALVRAESRLEIEQSVCDILARSDPYLFTWIGEYHPEAHRLLPRADSGLEAGFLDEIPVGEGSTLPEKGPGPRTIETGEVQVTQNVGVDPAFEEFREEVDSRGYRSVATVPLAHGSEFYGLLALYADRPDAFDVAERTLLESLGEDIGHAIHAVEAESAIRQERDLLDSLFETSPTGIVVLSPDGEIHRANKRAEEILELTESEITDRTYDEPNWVFTDGDGNPLPEENHPFMRALDHQDEIYDLELRMERSHADPIWVSINGAPLYDPDGALERIVFTFDDVTETKATQQKLEETNRTLDALFQAAPVGIVAQDPDGTITHWNDGAEEIFGWTAEEVLGRDHPPFVTGDAVEEYHDLFERTIAGKSFTGIEIQRERKDGTPVDLHLSAAPIHDTDGEPMGIMAVFADLTDQKARERQLRQFREAVEHAGHSVMITDTDGLIRYVNPAFEEQTGYSAEEALGRTPAILNSGEHDASFFEQMWETIQAGEVWEHEIMNQRKDGTLVHVDQTIAPVFGEDDAIEYFVAVNHDITDRREKELELERQNQRLAEFASVVSHDLRNPLNVAAGNLELLEAEGPHAEQLAAALERMNAIIDDVLTLAREGEVVDSVEPLDIGSLAVEAWAAVDGPADALVIVDEPTVDGDEGRTRRILENLCRNALEHVGPDVEVRVGGLDVGGFYVADDGHGIDPDLRESVMESGYTTAESGNGLGLPIVRRLAEAQGWSVSIVESQEGGARFEFRPTEAAVVASGDD